MIVMKFGGAALRDSQSIKNVAKIVNQNIEHDPIIVLSAVGGVTDELLDMGMQASHGAVDVKAFIELHEKICGELDVDFSIFRPLLKELTGVLSDIKSLGVLRLVEKDALLSFGERFSVRIFSKYLENMGIKSRAYDSWEIGIITTPSHSNTKILHKTYKDIRKFFETNHMPFWEIPVITGFIAKNSKGEITTLGRGGSDLTASIVGTALKCEEIQIWKDVDGILSAEPSIVPNAKVLRRISYREAHELAFFGAKILHPQSMIPSKKGNIPIRVKNFLFPDGDGTIISDKTDETEEGLKSLTCRKDITLVNIESPEMIGEYGYLARIFAIFKDLKISVDLIATSEASISLTLDNTVNVERLIKRLSSFSEVKVRKKMAIVSLIGTRYYSPTILSKIFYVFHKEGVNVEMISQGASKINIAFVIDEIYADKVIKALHKYLFEKEKSLEVMR